MKAPPGNMLTVTPHTRAERGRRVLRAFLLAAGCLGVPASGLPSSATDPGTKEFAVKAAFIFHFTQFVEWPPRGEVAELKVCVLGEDVFGDALRALESRSSRQKIAVIYPKTAAEARQCQIVYLASHQKDVLAVQLGTVQGSNTLTVGSVPGFVDQGGAIGFVIEGGKVRLEINTQATQRANLKLSSKLLEVATRVVTQSPRSRP